ncbi:general substrate transporter [Geopyxis carbonaria]|nr:general substrate transporter [Geopyxis carbonaria]
MAFGRAPEDRPTPPQVYNWRIYLMAVLTCTGAMIMGYSIGIIGGTLTLPAFHEAFKLPPIGTRDYAYITANIVSIMQGGAFFGSLAAVPVTERWGRRTGLAVGGGSFAIGSAICTFSYGRLSLMYLGRFLSGLGCGCTSLLVPLYISELSPPAIRGFLIGLFEIGNQLSSVTAFWVNFAALSIPASAGNAQWMTTLGLQIFPGTALLLSALFILPESPRWFVKHGATDRARKNLAWLRHLPEDHEYIIAELGAMREQVSREGGGTWRDLLGPGVRNRLAIGMTMMLCQNLTGINSINYYSPSIFRSVGLTDRRTTLFASGIWAIVKALATIGSLVFFIDSLGRRKLLLISAMGQAVVMLYIGGYVQTSSPPPAAIALNGGGSTSPQSPAGWVAVIAVYFYALFFCFAWNSVPWIYCAEIFPTRLRALCVSITTATQWLGQFGVARATPYALAEIRGGLYFIFGGFLLAMWTWVWLCLPETKGVPLEDMDRIFGVPGAGSEVRDEERADRELAEALEELEEKKIDGEK